MTWLVIGGSGQLGQALSRIMIGKKIQFIALNSRQLDITNADQCLKLVMKIKPDVIINAAAWTDVEGAEVNDSKAFAVNAIGVKNLTLAAMQVQAVFVHLSTDYVFSGARKYPWGEYDAKSPQSVYGKSKSAGEDFVLELYKEKSYIFRTAWLYSPWGKNFAKTMFNLAVNTDNQIKVVNDQKGQPTSALDLADQIVNSILISLPYGIYHATNSGEASWFDFALEIFKLTNMDESRVEPVSSLEYCQSVQRPIYSVLGHDSWSQASTKGERLEPMKNWKTALSETFPLIRSKY